MLNKKANEDYCRAHRQKKGDLYKVNDAERKKAERERGKYLVPKKIKDRSCPYQGIKKKKKKRFKKGFKKDFRAIIGQHCNVNLKNSTNHVFIIFNKTNFEQKCLQD